MLALASRPLLLGPSLFLMTSIWVYLVAGPLKSLHEVLRRWDFGGWVFSCAVVQYGCETTASFLPSSQARSVAWPRSDGLYLGLQNPFLQTMEAPAHLGSSCAFLGDPVPALPWSSHESLLCVSRLPWPFPTVSWCTLRTLSSEGFLNTALRTV